MEDAFREQRTMLLVAQIFPPLPVMVGKVSEDCNMVDYETVTNSHALLARCIDECAARNDEKRNKIRKEKQIRVFREFMEMLAKTGFWLEGRALYDVYCEFSYRHISSYFDTPPEVKFMPYEYMSVGDKTHAKLCEYFRGQGILFQEKNTPDVSNKPLGEILLLLRDRLGKACENEGK